LLVEPAGRAGRGIAVSINAVQQIAFWQLPQAYPLWNILIVALNILYFLPDGALAGLQVVRSRLTLTIGRIEGLWSSIAFGLDHPASSCLLRSS
jgi:hypothetical protein